MSSALNDTVPGILAPALFLSKNEELVTVDLCTFSLNVAVIKEVVETPVTPLAGTVLTAVGGVVSAVVTVVNDQIFGAIRLPEGSMTLLLGSGDIVAV